MFQSAFIRLYVLSLSVVIVTAMRQNCGRDYPACPAGEVCLPPGKQTETGSKGQWKCYDSSVVPACGPLPDFGPHVNVANYNGDTSIGYSFMYTCTPCTWYVDINVPSATITCQADGTWSTPTCVSAADTGSLFDGTLVPAGALGCTSCPSYSVPGGFLMSGSSSLCYCDDVCCDYGDCCYNFSCIY